MKHRSKSSEDCACERVAFTPKGGCPLKPSPVSYNPIRCLPVAFTPKGGCPLKLYRDLLAIEIFIKVVAFTPKGGCPLKHIPRRVNPVMTLTT